MLLIASCGERLREEAPPNLIDEDKFISILIDLHLVDAMIEIEKIPGDSTDLIVSTQFMQILEKHDVEVSKYEKTMKYYTEHPVQFEKLYEKLLQEMNLLESELNK